MMQWFARICIGIALIALFGFAMLGMTSLIADSQAVEAESIQSIIPTNAEIADAWETYRSDILGTFLPNTMRVTLAGFALSVILGLILATLMDAFAVLRWILYPFLVLSQTIPTFAIAVLLILVFGFGDSPKIVVVILFCFYAVTTNTLDGFRSVDQNQVDLLQTMGASPLQIWWHVRFPSALPSFFSGTRLAATYSVVGAVIGEYVGSGEGLGKFLQRSYRAFQTDQVFLTIAVIAALSIGLVVLVSLVELVALRWRWAGNQNPMLQRVRRIWQGIQK